MLRSNRVLLVIATLITCSITAFAVHAEPLKFGIGTSGGYGYYKGRFFAENGVTGTTDGRVELKPGLSFELSDKSNIFGATLYLWNLIEDAVDDKNGAEAEFYALHRFFAESPVRLVVGGGATFGAWTQSDSGKKESDGVFWSYDFSYFNMEIAGFGAIGPEIPLGNHVRLTFLAKPFFVYSSNSEDGKIEAYIPSTGWFPAQRAVKKFDGTAHMFGGGIAGTASLVVDF